MRDSTQFLRHPDQNTERVSVRFESPKYPEEAQCIPQMLHAIYRRITKDPWLVDEVVEFAVSTYLCRYANEPPKIMFSIARNHFKNLLRRRGVVSYVAPEDLDWISSRTNGDSSDVITVLQECVSRLPSRERQVLESRFFERQAKEQVARAMGCSVATVKRLERLAMDRIRTALKDCDR